MKLSIFYSFVFSVILGISVFAETAPTQPEPDKEGFVSLFNGKDMTGWEGIPGGWEVKDGCIVGESTPEKPCKRSHYLYYAGGEPADFHLKLKFRLTGSGNSGIQFRSLKKPNWDTWGYQADLDSSGDWTGAIYHHKFGAVVKCGFDDIINEKGEHTHSQFANNKELLGKIFKKNDWNEYELIADGSVMTLKINGEMTCRVDDKSKDALKKGIIALQMHQGPPMKIEFKEIKLKTFDGEKKK